MDMIVKKAITFSVFTINVYLYFELIVKTENKVILAKVILWIYIVCSFSH